MPKILCITSHDPDGKDYGAVVRVRHIFKLLGRFGEVRVVLAGFREAWSEHPQGTCAGFPLLRQIRFEWSERITIADRIRHELDPRFLNMDWFQATRKDQEWLEKTAAEHDIVWVHGLNTANRCNIRHWPHSVLDVDDINSEVHRSQQMCAGSLRQKIQAARKTILLRRQEKLLPERFTALCVCSEPDRIKLGHPEKTFVLPNGFEPPPRNFTQTPERLLRVGFVGSFEYEPNVQGVWWFVQNIWPLILKKYPAVTLRLVGTGSREQAWPAGQNIEPLGWLEDVAGEMATWSLAVAPILTGGGTRVKIAEAFSRRCPVVSTSLGAYGYDVADGRELLIADGAEAYAEKCLSLLASLSLRERLAAAAWEKFIKYWTWDAQAESVAAVVNKVLTARKV